MRKLVVAGVLIACNPQPTPVGTPPPYGPPYGAPQTQASGAWGCLDLMTCYGKCPGLTTECTGACDLNGTAAAQAANADVFRCIAQSGCQDEACISNSCGAPLLTCANTPGAANVAVAPQQPPPQAPGAPSALPAVSDAEFIFHGADGLDYVPELTVIAQGVSVSLEGTWEDSRRNFTLELHGSAYTASNAGAGLGGTAAHTIETGTWSLDGTTFLATPTGLKLGTTNRIHQDTEQQRPDAPRAWSLIGATLEFVKFGDPTRTVHRVDGLVLSGTAPSWDPVGAFNHTLRRAR